MFLKDDIVTQAPTSDAQHWPELVALLVIYSCFMLQLALPVCLLI